MNRKTFDLSAQLQITNVIANQRARWCGNSLKRVEMLRFYKKMF